MPIPLIVPVLATLYLAASCGTGGDDGDGGGGAGEWEVDVEDDVFDDVDGHRFTGIIEVDFRARTASARSYHSSAARGGWGTCKIAVTQKFSGRAVREFLDPEWLESLREVSEDPCLELLHGWERDSSDMERRVTVGDYVDEYSSGLGDLAAITNMLLLGLGFFEAGDEVSGTREEKLDAILLELTRWLRGEDGVAEVMGVPSDEVEVRRLTGNPTRGVRVVLHEGEELRDLDLKLHRFDDAVSVEDAGVDQDGRQAWDVYLLWSW